MTRAKPRIRKGGKADAIAKLGWPIMRLLPPLDRVRFRAESRSMDYMTVSSAKPRLGRLMDRVLKKGEPVIIRRGKRFVQLSEYTVPEPIPQRPPGYFAVSETPAEYERANRLSELSPDRPE